jgi:hypothetical protein
VKFLQKAVQPLALVATLAVFLGACDENLDGGTACPILCPQQQLTLQDTTLFAVELDTSIAGFPSLGSEVQFFIASLGDTLETAAIVRFDSLPQTFRRLNSVDDSTIVAVDSAYVRLALVAGDTIDAPTTIEVYDVDLDGAEEADPTSVTSAFTPDRLLGSATIAGADLQDSAKVFIDNARLLERIQRVPNGNRLRVGIRVTSTGNNRLSALSTNGGGVPLLIFRPSVDTAVPKITVLPMSRTPLDAFESLALADYQVVLRAPPPPASDVVRVGGLPGSRAYFRFNIPSNIIDSTNIVRATLILTQTPSPGAPEPDDSIGILPKRVIASPAVTDISRAMTLTQGGADSTRMTGGGAGDRLFEIIGLVRAWAQTSPDSTPRAMTLESSVEGALPRQVDFFSTGAANAAVRPRLRLTFLPRREETLP